MIGKPGFSLVEPPVMSKGFTLVELLVVLAVLGVLLTLTLPFVARSLEAARRAECGSNLRQLFLANAAYAAETGRYVAAAPDIFGANRRRWHGARASGSGAFDGATGSLSPFLGDKRIRRCPSFPDYRADAAAHAFEAACGGYGYNDRGVGSQAYWYGYCRKGVEKGMPPGAIQRPASTVMFCDTAFPQPYNNPKYLIEYSFAEAYRHLARDRPELDSRADPSIHFRHGGRANVVWCDGHVSAETMTLSLNAGGFGEQSIGWFGGPNNELFDPY